MRTKGGGALDHRDQGSCFDWSGRKLTTATTVWGPNASVTAGLVAVVWTTVHVRMCWGADHGRRNVFGVPG